MLSEPVTNLSARTEPSVNQFNFNPILTRNGDVLALGGNDQDSTYSVSFVSHQYGLLTLQGDVLAELDVTVALGGQRDEQADEKSLTVKWSSSVRSA